ncbi:aminoacylase-1-like isoform X4 [Pectinophora gossypiella]|uniref:aminoacylase-1-like isoform X4 n=1 Tax=Pectinophora gossypiella TaxID=13191 RepID=UPI00214EF5CB|nr:aminoacylase-1-like isoform X4 [Pectinophora gossypiella]
MQFGPQIAGRISRSRIWKMIKYFLYFFLGFKAASSFPLPTNNTQCYINNPAVQRFREYVQIDTSKPENLEKAVAFWSRQAVELGLVFEVHRSEGLPIGVMTWPGVDPSLPSIMLNSHMDVVPVDEEFWKYPPYSAHMEDNGNIYGRGTQDCKDVTIQYVEAIRRLKNNNVTLKRTVHVTLMPEIKITVKGLGGHGSSLSDGSAVQKLQRIMDAIGKYRDSQKKISNEQSIPDAGAYDSVNINIIKTGIAENVMPEKGYLVVDIRLAVSKSVDEMQQLVDSWIAEGGNGTEAKYLRRVEVSDATPTDLSRPYMQAIQEAAKEMNISIVPVLCPAASDMIILRSLGIPALGFAPKTYTPSRIHTSNEYLNAGTLLRGIDVYVNLLQKLGNLNKL